MVLFGRGGETYIHSNYICRGSSDVTKILTDSTDLDQIFSNVLGDDATPLSRIDYGRAKRQATLIADESLFNAGSTHIDLSGFGRVLIRRDDEPVAVPAVRLQRGAGIGWCSPINGDLYAAAGQGALTARTLPRLASRTVSPESVRTVLLAPGSSAKTALPSSRLWNACHHGGFPSAEAAEQVIALSKDQTVLIIGEIEGNSYTSRPEAGGVVQIPRDRIRAAAAAHNVALVELKVGAGRTEAADAVRRADRALSGGSLAGFLTTLASSERPLVVDSILDDRGGANISLTVYARPKNTPKTTYRLAEEPPLAPAGWMGLFVPGASPQGASAQGASAGLGIDLRLVLAGVVGVVAAGAVISVVLFLVLRNR